MKNSNLTESGGSHHPISGGERDTDEHLQNEGDAELSMAINLRGDESFFSDFSLDADEVMDQLGIKRSRLRQISGKELRVARKRVERYIKPFYRPVDVQDYLEWTRPTASHQRSSHVLNSAADHLFERSRAVTEHLDSVSLELSKQLTQIGDTGRNQLSDLIHVSEELLRSLRQASSERKRTEARLRSDLVERLDQEKSLNVAQTSRLMRVLDELLSSNQSFVDAIGIVQGNHHLMLNLQLSIKSQRESLDSIQAQISGIEESLLEPDKPVVKAVMNTGSMAEQRKRLCRHRRWRSLGSASNRIPRRPSRPSVRKSGVISV